MCNVISLNCIWCKSPLCIKSKIERKAFAIIATKYCFQSCFLDVAYVGNFCIVTSCILWYVFLTHDGHFFQFFDIYFAGIAWQLRQLNVSTLCTFE